MNEVAAEQTYMLAERFDKALKTIRSAVAGMDLEVAGEIDVADLLLHHPGTAARSRILLVDCPVLMFEALALDRAAAVFFPLHIFVIGRRQPDVRFVDQSRRDGRRPSSRGRRLPHREASGPSRPGIGIGVATV